jgi:hypothetical protein
MRGTEVALPADLAINLLVALIAFVSEVALRHIIEFRRLKRPAGRVWRVKSSTVQVVVADGPLSSYGFPTIHPAEFAAATEISMFLQHGLNTSVGRVCSASAFPANDLLEETLVIIGGPVHNSLYRTFAAEIALPYYFDDRDLVRAADEHRFRPIMSTAGVASVDYGLVVSTANPFNAKSRVVLLAGCKTFGCLGAARALIGPFVRTTAKSLPRTDNFCLVVKMNVLDQYVGKIEIVDSAPL